MSKTQKVTSFSAKCSARDCETRIGLGGEEVGKGEAEDAFARAGWTTDGRGNWHCPRHKATAGAQVSQAVPDETTA